MCEGTCWPDGVLDLDGSEGFSLREEEEGGGEESKGEDTHPLAAGEQVAKSTQVCVPFSCSSRLLIFLYPLVYFKGRRNSDIFHDTGKVQS